MRRTYWKSPLHIIIFAIFVGSIALAGLFIFIACIGLFVNGVPAEGESEPVSDFCFNGCLVSLIVWIFSIPVFVADLVIYLINKKRFNNKTPNNVELSLNTESVTKAVESTQKMMTDGGMIADIKKEGEEIPAPLHTFPITKEAKRFGVSLFLSWFMMGPAMIFIAILGVAISFLMQLLMNLNNPINAVIPACIMSGIVIVIVIGFFFILAAAMHSNRKNVNASDMCINIYEDRFENYYKFETVREGLKGELRYKFPYKKAKTFETKKFFAVKNIVNGQAVSMYMTKDELGEAIEIIKQKIKEAKNKN